MSEYTKNTLTKSQKPYLDISKKHQTRENARQTKPCSATPFLLFFPESRIKSDKKRQPFPKSQKKKGIFVTGIVYPSTRCIENTCNAKKYIHQQ
ncbi:MAG: hypothetical protein NC252_03005 [Roseburia sp.]|nr:hypothetical protein [Roseburia sp.]MCM1421946.1 hypothetical protein [Bacteroides sp.]